MSALKIQRPAAIVALLTALNFLNYVDRYLIAAVAPRFQHDLSFDDTETGFVMSAFMVGYFITSPFFGRLGDRATKGKSVRTPLIAFGVAMWSLATVASGFATSLRSMILARVCVGIGEASYATLAPTIIDDLAPPDKKNKYLAVFYMATPVGSALGFVLGGFLEAHYGWRSAFFVAGGPGLLLAFLAMFIQEPARKIENLVTTAQGAYAALARRPLFVFSVLGACAYTFALGGFVAWAPTFLNRVHRMDLQVADFRFGVIAVLSGIVGTVIGGTFADRGLAKNATDEDRVRRYMRFSAIGTLIAAPAAMATIFAPTPTTFFVLIFVCETALFISTSPMNAVTLGSVPAPLRGTAMAVSIFAIHALGDFISPTFVGFVSTHSNIRLAMTILPVMIGVCTVLWLRGARAAISREGAPAAT
jgi:MFS family permease